MAKQEEEEPWSQEVLTGQSKFDNATVFRSFNAFAGKFMICVRMCESTRLLACVLACVLAPVLACV